MKKIIQLSLIAMLVVLMAAVVMLSGCTSSGQPTGGPQDGAGYQGGNPPPQFGNRTGGPRGGGFGNMTQEQRQQMFEQRMQLAKAACDGKAAGDQCVSSSPRGNRTSTCELQNSTLLCAGGFGRGGQDGMPFNRTAPQN